MPAAAWLASYELGGEIMMRTIPYPDRTVAHCSACDAEMNTSEEKRSQNHSAFSA
jgi:hypothetical protein